MTNHEILGVKPEATQDEIKKAYRRLAHKHHPDKGGSPEKFKEIQQAYKELQNTQTRPIFREDLFKQQQEEAVLIQEYESKRQEEQLRHERVSHALEKWFMEELTKIRNK